ncbi:cysteine desulfurase [Luteolibacter arcticus]|uniref:cysteine desulfurase n=1 Tax=Luteolibacter arcticus TaxID=1581411 RepID=A0ABT3GM24_9BACT|nr:cysteine desulfurase family protein [Luteolibacter arcticus]MCW1924553.1 cysteine desulfurase [Luteolibacter arcticus]
MIYLDANATTSLLPEVLDAMLPWLREGFHNPNASYRGAKDARKAIEDAREKVAALIGAESDEVVFTGGGTESTNSALKWLARLVGRKSGRVITSAIEHSAVLKPCETFAEVGYEVARIGVDGGGRLKLEDIEAACDAAKDGGGFVSLMWANNETGVIQPIEEACAVAKERGLAFHTDAIQAVGKIPVNVREVPVDYLSLSAHKFHGPKGVGALYIRSGCRFEPMIRGGGQEKDRRSGTENTAGIVGLGKAAELAMERLSQGVNPAALRNAFEAKIVGEVSGVTVNGDLLHRLPGTSHLSFTGCEAAGLLILLDDLGVACSAGSACMTGKQQPSHVQKAMGFSDVKAKSSLRFGFSCLNTMEEAMAAAEAVKKSVEKLRRVQGGSTGPVVVYSP